MGLNSIFFLKFFWIWMTFYSVLYQDTLTASIKLKPVHDWYCTSMCFSTQVCFNCIGRVFRILVLVKTEIDANQVFSRWRVKFLTELFCVHNFYTSVRPVVRPCVIWHSPAFYRCFPFMPVKLCLLTFFIH